MSGVTVVSSTSPPARRNVFDTSRWFVAAEVGGTLATPVEVRNMSQFEAAFEARVGDGVPGWDALDAYFRLGGKSAIVSSYDNDWTDALYSFGAKYGPGQVSVIGETPSQSVYATLAAHANRFGRFAVADVGNGDDPTAWEALGAALPDDETAENIGLFGSWVNIGPPAGVSGASTRKVQASPVIAALCARVDALGNVNRAAGGRDFPLDYVQSLVYDPTDSEFAALQSAHVNTFREILGVLENYSFRTGVAKSPDTPFWQANCSRARMWLQARSYVIGQNYYLKPIDAEGHTASRFAGELKDVAMELYGVDGLYGRTPQEAFAVDVEVSVDDAEQALMEATMQARLTNAAEDVRINLVSVPVSGVIA